MKSLRCWRCRMEVPMLDDEEFERIFSNRGSGTGDIREKEFGPVLGEYERITGLRETNINALWHHQASFYGPPLFKLRTAAKDATLRIVHETRNATLGHDRTARYGGIGKLQCFRTSARCENSATEHAKPDRGYIPHLTNARLS